jgi:hypothetical protein
MPKQYMSIRNKRHVGPQNPHVASKGKRIHAEKRGYDAWVKFGKSITDNPYRPGLLNDAWRKGYLQAAQYKCKSVENRAAEGSARHKDSYVVVKRTGATKSLPARTFREPKDNDPYLGYINPGKNGKLRKFRVWTGNPPEDQWRDRIACKSEIPDKLELRKDKWLRV